MVTAYDAPSARLADAAGVDIILVGDSAATTVLGLRFDGAGDDRRDADVHARRRARRRRARSSSPTCRSARIRCPKKTRCENAIRFVKEGGAEAVKLEGAGRTITRISGIVDAGIPVMGHIGLTPQSATKLGGYRAQGRTAATAKRLVDEAIALERVGCFAIVLEAMPAVVAKRITEAVHVPTIGIGAGASCTGQVLVWHDLLGLLAGPAPRFVKHYADLGRTITRSDRQLRRRRPPRRVSRRRHTYGMPDAELERFESGLTKKS